MLVIDVPFQKNVSENNVTKIVYFYIDVFTFSIFNSLILYVTFNILFYFYNFQFVNCLILLISNFCVFCFL